MRHAKDGLYMASNGFVQHIGPETDAAWARFELLVRDDFDHMHCDDTFDDLKRRARFSKEDQGLLRDWMAIAAHRAETAVLPDTAASTR